MRRFALILTLCAGCCLAASAQTTFTEQLQQSKAGEGKVTITQDKSIDQLVNTPTTSAPSRSVSQPYADKNTQGSQGQVTSGTSGYDLTPDTTSLDLRKKIMKGQKANGFRVQVFAGGNSRNDRLKAERTGEEMKAFFPYEPVYVHFYSPRWVCRIGNYRTYEEAHEVLNKVKQLGYMSAVIVKGKITVFYP